MSRLIFAIRELGSFGGPRCAAPVRTDAVESPLFVVGCGNGSIHIVDVRTRRVVCSALAHSQAVLGVELFEIAQTGAEISFSILSNSRDGIVAVCRAVAQLGTSPVTVALSQLLAFQSYNSTFCPGKILFREDQRIGFVAPGGTPSCLQVWLLHLDTQEPRAEPLSNCFNAQGHGMCMSMFVSGSSVFVGFEDGFVFELTFHRSPDDISLHSSSSRQCHRQPVLSICCKRVGDHLYSLSTATDGTVLLCRSASSSLQPLSLLRMASSKTATESVAGIQAALVLEAPADSPFAVALGGWDNRIHLIRVSPSFELTEFEVIKFHSGSILAIQSPPTALVVPSAGVELLCCSNDGKITAWCCKM